MPEYGPEAEAGAFVRSRGLLEALIGRLSSAELGVVTHAEVEELLEAEGRELLRQLFQDHLDLRAVREERLQRVAGADEVERTRTEHGHVRQLATVFGTVRVERIAYRAPGAANLHPADAVLNLPAGKHSHGLRRLAALETVRGSFADACGRDRPVHRRGGSVNDRPNSSRRPPLLISRRSTRPDGPSRKGRACWWS